MAAVGITGGDPDKVDVAGDTMTGPLVLPGNPTLPLHAATKQYVDAATGGEGAVISVNGETGEVVLDAADVGASPTGHTHTIANVTGLQTALDGKAASEHEHEGGGGAASLVYDSGIISSGTQGTDGYVSTTGDGTQVHNAATFAAVAGDRIEVLLDAMRDASGGELRIDACTMVGGNPNRWFSSGTTTKRPGGMGGSYLQASRFVGPSSTLWHTVNADDISAGNVTVSVRAITDDGANITVRANDVFGARILIKKWSAPA